MEQYLQPILDYLRNNPQTAMILTFLIALIESLPVLGTIFPGSITMTAIGALIGAGVIPGVGTCISAIVGAFLGDILGFWLGNRYQHNVRKIWPLNKLSKYLHYGEKFFHKHGGKSIIIGRFIGPMRSTMPLVAGILHWTWSRFLPAALIAAILWSLVYIAPGIILGALAMDLSRNDMMKVILIGLAIIVGLWLIFWALQYFFRRLSQAIDHPIQIWWKQMSQPPAGFFVRLIRNPQHPLDFHPLKLTLWLVLCAAIFLLILFEVSHQGWITSINQPLFYLTQSFRTPTSDHFWVALTILGTPKALLATCLLAGAGLIGIRGWRAGAHLILLGIITAFAVELIKKLVHSPRPTGLAWFDVSSSFPSGHTTLSVAVFGFLAFLTVKIISRSWRKVFYTLAILLTLLVSLSRLMLGQHWLTDILGAWFLGLCVLLLIEISFRRLPQTQSILQIKKHHWLVIVTFSLMLPWIIAEWLEYSPTCRGTRNVFQEVHLNLQQWWQQPLARIPLYRLNRFGRPAQPFNVQWAGSLDEIQDLLLKQGWEIPPPSFSLIFPWLYHNQPPVLFLIRRGPNPQDILELRLWRSDVTFNDLSVPLWLGILNYHTPPEKLLRFPHRHVQLLSGNILRDSQPEHLQRNIEIVHIPRENQPEQIRGLHWDGDVFIFLLDDA